jgi:hypothetical protein
MKDENEGGKGTYLLVAKELSIMRLSSSRAMIAIVSVPLSKISPLFLNFENSSWTNSQSAMTWLSLNSISFSLVAPTQMS